MGDRRVTDDSALLRTPDSRRGKLPTHVALLRGINLGGKNAVPMAELRRWVEEAGGKAVRTYVQSGNVLFDATLAAAARIAAAITTHIKEQLGFTVPVVLLTADELRQIAGGNPYLAEGKPENELHLMLLSSASTPERVAKLDPDRSPPDRFTVAGRAIYIHAPNGVARSKLTNDYFDRALGVTSTARNWRTVGKLLALSGEA
jgi:uncharacterized protein (DUF1697 family)